MKQRKMFPLKTCGVLEILALQVAESGIESFPGPEFFLFQETINLY
jgi:hypothetical protein